MAKVSRVVDLRFEIEVILHRIERRQQRVFHHKTNNKTTTTGLVGEEVSGPMLAIEAGMAQRLLHNGLHLPRMICAAFFRDYLTPAEVNAFDLYGGSSGGTIKHYLDYPIAKKNRRKYIRN